MIITLCGSNRFEEYFKAINEALSLQGHAVFTTSVYPSFKDSVKDWYTPEQKTIVDRVHLDKISASDAIVIINPFAYIGESTLNEIEFAQAKSKRIYALESWGEGIGINGIHANSVIKLADSYGIPRNFGSPIDTSRFRSIWDNDLAGSAGQSRSNYVATIRRVYYG